MQYADGGWDKRSWPGVETAAALIFLFAYEAINLVGITTVKIRSDLFQSKFCPPWLLQY